MLLCHGDSPLLLRDGCCWCCCILALCTMLLYHGDSLLLPLDGCCWCCCMLALCTMLFQCAIASMARQLQALKTQRTVGQGIGYTIHHILQPPELCELLKFCNRRDASNLEAITTYSAAFGVFQTSCVILLCLCPLPIAISSDLEKLAQLGCCA